LASRRGLNLRLHDLAIPDMRMEKICRFDEESIIRDGDGIIHAHNSERIRVPSSPLIPYREPVIDLPSYLLITTKLKFENI
jgi:hypothetical protein